MSTTDDIPPEIRAQNEQDRQRDERTRRACGSLGYLIGTAQRAVAGAVQELADLRITDFDGLAGSEGEDAGEALAAAALSLRNARRVVTLREMELERQP